MRKGADALCVNDGHVQGPSNGAQELQNQKARDNKNKSSIFNNIRRDVGGFLGKCVGGLLCSGNLGGEAKLHAPRLHGLETRPQSYQV